MTKTNKTLEGYAYVEGIAIPEYSKFQSSYYPFADYKPFFGTYKSDSEFEFDMLEYPTFESTRDIIISNYDLPTRYVQVNLPVLTVKTLGLYNKTEISEVYNNFDIDSIEFSIKEKINSNSNFNESVSIYAQKYSDGVYTITNSILIKRSDFEEVNTSINISANTRLEDSDFVYYTPESESIETGTIVINLKFRSVSVYDSAINIVNSSVSNLSVITNKMKLFYESMNLNDNFNVNTLSSIKNSSKLYSESLNLNTTINTLSSIENILNTANNNDISLVAEITTLSVEENEQTEILS